MKVVERNSRVDAWLQLLGLSHVADCIVGDALVRGVSGGERRRVSIGVSAVAGHRLVIADSPTNGLDSDAAFNVIKTMRALADASHNGFMVSVRQPSKKLLELFDTVCLMSRGKCMFFGRVDEAYPFFQSLGFVKPITKSLPDFLEEMTGNPSKFFSQPSGEKKEEEEETRHRRMSVEAVQSHFVKSEFYQRLGRVRPPTSSLPPPLGPLLIFFFSTRRN